LIVILPAALVDVAVGKTFITGAVVAVATSAITRVEVGDGDGNGTSVGTTDGAADGIGDGGGLVGMKTRVGVETSRDDGSELQPINVIAVSPIIKIRIGDMGHLCVIDILRECEKKSIIYLAIFADQFR
jgi:hypothetical protein